MYEVRFVGIPALAREVGEAGAVAGMWSDGRG